MKCPTCSYENTKNAPLCARCLRSLHRSIGASDAAETGVDSVTFEARISENLAEDFARQEEKDIKRERRVNSIKGCVSLIVGIFLSYISVQSLTATTHDECTRWVRNGDGRECIGEWVSVAGNDPLMAILFGIFAVISLALAVTYFKNNPVGWSY